MVYYLGSTTTLPHYANTKVLDGDKSKITVAVVAADPGFDAHTASTYPANQGLPVHIENVPTRIEWQENAPVSDVLKEHGMIVVPARFKEIVEQFEPGVHQFLPVQYIDKQGKILAERYYFIACNRLDSVDRKSPAMILFKGMWIPARDLVRRKFLDQIPAGFDVNAEPKIVFNNDQIGDNMPGATCFCR